MRRKAVWLIGICLGAGATSAPAAEQDELSLGVGFNYSSGDYGTSTTTQILTIPFMVRYEHAPWTLKLTVPYIRVSGGTAVVPGVGRVNNSNPNGRGRGAGGTASEASASGLGDVVGAASYNIYNNRDAKLGADLTGKIKFGTADRDKGLGTGENDYFLQVDAYKTVDRVTGFGSVGRAYLGSSPFIQLNNVWYLNLGASYQLNERDSAGLSFDARQRASASSDPQRELTAFWVRKLDRATKVHAYALVGLANGSPDWGLGASLAYAF